jgi:predicted SAM-dependent methyltransferase
MEKGGVMEQIKLHLAGGKHYLPGWVNVDLGRVRKKDLTLDLTKQLPYQDNSVDFIFSEHFIEHLSYEQGISFLKECYRILKAGGVMRTSTPSLEWLLNQYYHGSVETWGSVAKYWQPHSKCSMLNSGIRITGHLFTYDREELHNSLRIAGFTDTYDTNGRESKCQELQNVECRRFYDDLITESIK